MFTIAISLLVLLGQAQNYPPMGRFANGPAVQRGARFCNSPVCNFNCPDANGNDCTGTYKCGRRCQECNFNCEPDHCHNVRLVTNARNTFVGCKEENSCTNGFQVDTDMNGIVASANPYSSNSNSVNFGNPNNRQGNQGNQGWTNPYYPNQNQVNNPGGHLNVGPRIPKQNKGQGKGKGNAQGKKKAQPAVVPQESMTMVCGMKACENIIVNCNGNIRDCKFIGMQNHGSGMSFKHSALNCNQSIKNARCLAMCGDMMGPGVVPEHHSCDAVRFTCRRQSTCACCGSSCIYGMFPGRRPRRMVRCPLTYTGYP